MALSCVVLTSSWRYFFTFLGEPRQVMTKREYNACMRNGGRDAEATVFACAALGGISLPRLLS